MEAHDRQFDPFTDLITAPAVAPGEALWLRYNYSSGQARTGALTPDGTSIVLRDSHSTRAGPTSSGSGTVGWRPTTSRPRC